jgi:hypothetical protein
LRSQLNTDALDASTFKRSHSVSGAVVEPCTVTRMKTPLDRG